MSGMKATVLCLLSFLFCTPLIANQSPVGIWKIIDDKTGKKRALVKITQSGEQLKGQIIKIYRHPGDTGVCRKCPGQFKGKPVVGLNFLWGLQPVGKNLWDKGQLLDPKSGKIYRVKLTQRKNTLNVRGYIGTSMLGKTQIWHRARQ